MFTIAIANQKGGVGKTTTAVTLAHALALRDYRVLLIDLDPQGHCAFSLGLQKKPGLYHLLVDSLPLAKVVASARDNLHVVLSDKQTEAVKRYVTTLNFRERVLVDALSKADYDVCIFDLAPSLDVLHVAALLASNFILIPTKLDALAIDGVNQLLQSMAEVIQSGHSFVGYSILPTFFDRQTRETLTQLEDLVQAFPDNVWPPVSQDVKARESAAYGQTLWEYSPHSTSAIGYQVSDGKRVGGYTVVVDRIQEIMNGQG